MKIGDKLTDEIFGILGSTGDEETPGLRRSGGEFAGSVAVTVAESGRRGIVVDAELTEIASHVTVTLRSHNCNGVSVRFGSEAVVRVEVLEGEETEGGRKRKEGYMGGRGR